MPLGVGLTVVTATATASGDVESAKSVAAVADGSVHVAAAGEVAKPGRGTAAPLNARRAIRSVDQDTACSFAPMFTAVKVGGPEAVVAGATGITFSARLLAGIKTGHDQTIRLWMPDFGGTVEPEFQFLRRVEDRPVTVAVILNDTPVNVPAVHAQCDSNASITYASHGAEVRFVSCEYLILDDPRDPIVLMWRMMDLESDSTGKDSTGLHWVNGVAQIDTSELRVISIEEDSLLLVDGVGDEDSSGSEEPFASGDASGRDVSGGGIGGKNGSVGGAPPGGGAGAPMNAGGGAGAHPGANAGGGGVRPPDGARARAAAGNGAGSPSRAAGGGATDASGGAAGHGGAGARGGAAAGFAGRGPGDGHAGSAAERRLERALIRDRKVVVYGIYFDFAKAVIRKQSGRVLQEIADLMQRNPSWSLAINGYTDSIGGAAYNLALSNHRAAAVRDTLVKGFHIAAARLVANGYGAASPVDSNSTLEGRARNRRVELMRQ